MISYFCRKSEKSKKKRFYILKVNLKENPEENGLCQEDEIILWAEGVIFKNSHKSLFMWGQKKVIQESRAIMLGNCEVMVED